MLFYMLKCLSQYVGQMLKRISLMWLSLTLLLVFGISVVYFTVEKFEQQKAEREYIKESVEKFAATIQEKIKEVPKNMSFAEKMIWVMHARYDPHHRFYNVDDPIHKSVHELPLTCAVEKRPFQFSPRFKSYCWFENDCGCNTQPSLIRCLPKFQLIGFPKSGTTDLFNRLGMHPDVIADKKESNYWSVGRFSAYNRTLNQLNMHKRSFTEADVQEVQDTVDIKPEIRPYLNFFLKDMPEFEADFMRSNNKSSRKIIGEGSVTYVYGSMGLRMSVGKQLKKPMMEVDCHLGKIIKWLTPEAKIVISVRDPVERLYSDYRNLFTGLKGSEKTAKDFHERVVRRINDWDQCVAEHSKEYCATSPMFEAIPTHNHLIGLARSMYSIHIKKWLEEFPREQILVVHLEDRIRRGTKALEEIMDFLELDPLPRDKMEEIMNMSKTGYSSLRPHQAGYGKENMLETTRKILQDFYRPFNLELVRLLDDDLYLWYDNEERP